MPKVMSVGLLLAAGLGLTACATQDYVDQHVGAVQGQVNTLQAQQQATDQTAREALARAEAAGKLAAGKFDYTMVMSDDSAHFPVNGAALSSDETARLNDFASKLKTDNRNVYLEIQGYTDSTGSPQGNLRLGADRAEAVRRYLSEQGVPLNRMATISYGEDHPVAPNSTRDGRSQNRRVVVVVLE